MAKAKQLLQLICAECGNNMIQKYDQVDKSFYLVCPGLYEKCPISKDQKFKVPEALIDLEPYE